MTHFCQKTLLICFFLLYFWVILLQPPPNTTPQLSYGHQTWEFIFCYVAKTFRGTFVTHASEIYDIGTKILKRSRFFIKMLFSFCKSIIPQEIKSAGHSLSSGSVKTRFKAISKKWPSRSGGLWPPHQQRGGRRPSAATPPLLVPILLGLLLGLVF